MIDKLIGSPDFVEHWTNKWADLLQVNRKFLGDEGAAFRKVDPRRRSPNMPYDQFAYAILTASGSNVDNPPAAYFKILRTPDETMENTTHLFLAVRFNCNKCHDHPFERWTQDQYYHLAAYFAQVGRKEDPPYKGQKIGGTAVDEKAAGRDHRRQHKRRGQARADRPDQARRSSRTTMPCPPGDDQPPRATGQVDHLEGQPVLRQELRQPHLELPARRRHHRADRRHPRRQPADQPATARPLTQEFIESKFDVRELIKTICKSRTYQLSIATNKWNKDDDDQLLARHRPPAAGRGAVRRGP